ncbi:hypothetical protein ACMAZF_00155 [Psychrobium sp. nBUS_13]|uniref:hypothetical protein n=1 Tax=Psychrobium sp. nBUS_13 TaxID=3395319 RepID=UPI003EBD4828
MKSLCYKILAISALSFCSLSSFANDIESITVLGKSAVANATHGGVDVKLLPINVHVVNREEIERLRFVDPNELLDIIPAKPESFEVGIIVIGLIALLAVVFPMFGLSLLLVILIQGVLSAYNPQDI